MQFSLVTSYFPPLCHMHISTMYRAVLAHLGCVLCKSLRSAGRQDATKRNVLVIQTNVRPHLEDTPIQHSLHALRKMTQFALKVPNGWTKQLLITENISLQRLVKG